MGWLPYLTMFLLGLVGVMLIFIILLQRGRGGGLAGALGGMGGQSAFGTKAGDVFTRITVALAAIWMVLAATNVYALRYTGTKYTGGTEAVSTAPSMETTKEGEKEASDAESTKALLKKLGEQMKAEKAEGKPATPETTTPEDKKPAEATTPEKATEKPAEETKPATPEETPKTEKPAEPATDDAKKPE